MHLTEERLNLHDRMERVSWELMQADDDSLRFSELRKALDWTYPVLNNVLAAMHREGYIGPRHGGPIKLTRKFYEEVLEEEVDSDPD